jgi:hypothetical protein
VAARLALALLTGFLVGGCNAAAPSTPGATLLAPSGSPGAPSVGVPTFTPSPVPPSPLPSFTPTPAGTAPAFARWRRDDLPDPTSEPFRRGTPSDVTWFQDRFVAVGSTGECCADADPSASQGRIWTSRDGESWRLLARDPTFKHASLHELVSDGERLLVVGWYADPIPGELPVGEPAVWVSLDGRTWTRAAGPVPSHVAIGKDGFVGALVVEREESDATQFMFSNDGLNWSFTSDALDFELRGLAGDSTGLAVGVGISGDPDSTGLEAIAYRTSDGHEWHGPSTIVEDGFARSISATPDGFLAVGWQSFTGPSSTSLDLDTIWHSPDGVTWTPLPLVVGDEEGLRTVHALRGALVVTGTAQVDGRQRLMIWVSTDGGRSWGRVPSQGAFDGVDNEISGIVETPSGLLAVGSRLNQETIDLTPVVWRATP